MLHHLKKASTNLPKKPGVIRPLHAAVMLKPMKCGVALVPAMASLVASKVLLFLANSHDPGGSNLLVTGVVALVVFIPLWLSYRALTKKH